MGHFRTGAADVHPGLLRFEPRSHLLPRAAAQVDFRLAAGHMHRARAGPGLAALTANAGDDDAVEQTVAQLHAFVAAARDAGQIVVAVAGVDLIVARAGAENGVRTAAAVAGLDGVVAVAAGVDGDAVAGAITSFT